MDLILLVGIAVALLIIMITIYLLQNIYKKSEEKSVEQQRQHQQQRGVPQRAQEGVPRRAQIARNQRNRLRQNVAAQIEHVAVEDANAADSDDEAAGGGGRIPQGAVLDEKMGTKKRAKMEAREQKRLMREQELHEREQRKVKEAKNEEERKRQDELDAEEERKNVEAERSAREERERKEHEEYLKMKAAFSVEEEGFEEADDAEKENLLADFVQHIKDNKVVVLEDLATEFKLKTQHAIERIQELQANGTLTGVIDDRGKFIFISEQELAAVAKFIKQRGRVSIAELAECSNNLINLTSVAAAGESSA